MPLDHGRHVSGRGHTPCRRPTAGSTIFVVGLWALGGGVVSAGIGGCKALPLLGGRGVEGPAAGAGGDGKVAADEPTIRVYSDALPVNAIAYRPPHLWAGNDRGLVRWDIETGDVQHAGVDEGLPGRKVSALAFDAAGALWVVTEAGLGRVQGKKYTPMPPTSAQITLVAPLSDGSGAWAAGPRGLYRTDGRTWSEVDIYRGTAVTFLELDPDGTSVWVSTKGRGVARVDGRGVRSYGKAEGFDLQDAVGTVTLDTGVHLAAGRGADGSGVLLWIADRGVDVLTALPDVPIQRIARVGNETVLLAGSDTAPKLFKLRSVPRGEPAPEGGFRLLPVRKGPDAPRYAAIPLALAPPPGTTVIAASGDALLFGTRSLGVARADVGTPTYYRYADLVEDAVRVTVGCVAADRCYVATGGPNPWLFDGARFHETSVGQPKDARVQAVVANAASEIFAISQEPLGKDFIITRTEAGRWRLHRRIPVTVPEGVPRLTFVALSPSGSLWMGVEYQDKEGEARPYGAVEEDVARQRALHHRSYGKEESGPPGALPMNNALTGIAFDGASIWLSSRVGVIRWHESEMKVWSENEGLETEVCHDVALGPGRQVAVATADGVGTFDGRVWSFPAGGPARVRTHALARDGGGRLWAASPKGLVLITDRSTRIFGSRNGLVEDAVVDVTVDSLGRAWALGEESIAVIE